MSSAEDENDNYEEIENGHISSESNFTDEEDTSDEPNENSEGYFNTDLPVAHRYLGKLNNTSKYTVYDDGEILEILAIHTNTLVFPGFTLPLIMNNHFENTVILSYIQKSKSIALIAADAYYKKIYTHGTILEIFEHNTKNGVLNLKARGRQRFRLVPGSEIKNLAGRLQMIQVQALGERPINSPLMDTQMLTLKSKRGYTSQNFRYFTKLDKYRSFHLAQYPFPKYVYDNYEIARPVEIVLSALSNYEYLPKDPVQLSYWFPQNYQLNHEERLYFMSADSTLERLKLACKLLKRLRHICCKKCGETISNPSKVFSMSKDGIQSNYVNPGGHVYETVTVSEAEHFSLIGSPSKQFSWFPGYAWTIMQCSHCCGHLGWKFSSSHLKPKVFYGLANNGYKIEVAEHPDDFAHFEHEELHGDLGDDSITYTDGFYWRRHNYV
ncbi:unnamed protein product [Brassicogethes aeneus]|uniref:Protein cereblon n=1 Tax=Brassicogethes aeneus TaxID=1431903 RepID=A0A9P0FB98_BRAAE|nr:unnamed protein product [Brassicogethes aeneus]